MTAPQQSIPSLEQAMDQEPVFERAHDGYRMVYPRHGATFEIAFVRRESGQLKGELMTRTANPRQDRNGSGVLSITDINLSAARTRKSHGTYLAERAGTGNSVDWVGMLEDFAQAVLMTERQGEPAQLLSEFPDPEPVSTWSAHGFPLLQRHPSILFGDGSSAKSLLSLWWAGYLGTQGRRVLYCDWELDGPDHKARLSRLYPDELPPVAYVRCRRPLFYEAERIRRIVLEHEIDFLVLDSISFAADGPPEAAEVAGRYFQALRSIGEVGSLSTAHVTKNGEATQKKPFGSSMWYNGARSIWNIQRSADEPTGSQVIKVALHDRKHNLGGTRHSMGYRIVFHQDRVTINPCGIEQIPEATAGMSIWDRVVLVLQSGPLRRGVLRAELDDVPSGSLNMVLSQMETAQHVLVQPGPDGAESDRLSLLDTMHGDGG